MVFQNYALYPHMTVFDNMAFSLKLAGEPDGAMRKRVNDAAQILGLTEYLERYPRQLSGGQRQRVAMGRAIVREPQVFLFDEPLSNLDAKLRVEMRTEIKALHLRLKTTSIYVTHDQIEAMTMADQIVVMNAGRVEQIGTPLELYDNPANLFVAGFIGSPAMNFLAGRMAMNGAELAVAVGDGIHLPMPLRAAVAEGREVIVGVRPEHFARGRQPACPPKWSWSSRPAPTRRYSASSRASTSPRWCASAMTFSPATAVRLKPECRPICSIRRAARGSPDDSSFQLTEETMSKIDRRDFLKIISGPRRRRGAGRAAARAAQAQSARDDAGSRRRAPSCACCAGSASCRATKTCGWQNTKKFSAADRRRGARRQRKLGRRAAEGGGRGQRRHRSRHHPVDRSTTRNLYPDKLLDVTDVANYLGKKYGGWYDVCKQYLQPDGKRWIGIAARLRGQLRSSTARAT